MKTNCKSSHLVHSLVAACLMASGLCLFSSSAQATLLINNTDVGTLDIVMGAVDSKNSGLQTEEKYLEKYLCNSTCTVTLVDNVDISNGMEITDGINHYIYVAPSTPSYYVLKFGNGNEGNDMFFMQNNASLNYLAWSDEQLIAEGLPANHVQSLSHYAITANAIPEPGTIALLGIALFAAGLARRRHNT